MEKESEQENGVSTITDRPSPGSGYVTFLLLVFGTSLTVLAVLAGYYYDPLPKVAYCLWGASALTAALAAVVLDAAFRTSYHLEGRVLTMKCGLFDRTLDLTQVREMSRCGTIWRVLGRGFASRGYANRFVNGIRLDTTDREKIYLSPTNPQLFLEHVRHYRFGKSEMPVHNS